MDVKNESWKDYLIIMLVLLVGVLIGMLCSTIYFKYINSKEEEVVVEEKEEKHENVIPTSVPINDTFAYYIDVNDDSKLEVMMDLYLLYDGKLYYDYVNEDTVDSFMSYYPYDFPVNLKNMKEINVISDIKRIKSVNLTTGVHFDLLLITNDGKVYTYNKNINSVLELEDFKDFLVEDILEYSPAVGCTTDSYELGYCKSHYEILLKDGSLIKN